MIDDAVSLVKQRQLTSSSYFSKAPSTPYFIQRLSQAATASKTKNGSFKFQMQNYFQDVSSLAEEEASACLASSEKETAKECFKQVDKSKYESMSDEHIKQRKLLFIDSVQEHIELATQQMKQVQRLNLNLLNFILSDLHKGSYPPLNKAKMSLMVNYQFIPINQIYENEKGEQTYILGEIKHKDLEAGLLIINEDSNGKVVINKHQVRTKDTMYFYTAFFCPYAQMAEIALYEKQVEDVEFLEGLTISGQEYIVHEGLRKLNRSGVPTVRHKRYVLDGSVECIQYIDEQFGAPHFLIPQNEDAAKRQLQLAEWVQDCFLKSFYGMLLKQDRHLQENEKAKFLEDIQTLMKQFKGPYFFGESFSVVDITLAPYFQRLAVLKHYRDFEVPIAPAFDKWHQWVQQVLKRKTVKESQRDLKLIIASYQRYADATTRSGHYYWINDSISKSDENENACLKKEQYYEL